MPDNGKSPKDRLSICKHDIESLYDKTERVSFGMSIISRKLHLINCHERRVDG